MRSDVVRVWIVVAAIGLAARVGAAQTVHLAWDPAVAHGIGYHVYRSDRSGGPYKRLTSTPVQSLYYSDTTTSGGHSYCYVVTSADAAGSESAYSTELCVTVGKYARGGAIVGRTARSITARSGQLVLLSGAAWQPDRRAVIAAWTQVSGPAVSLVGRGKTDAAFLAPWVSGETQFVFVLTVTDAGGNSAFDTVQVTIRSR